jgi:hypothetical protein
MPTKTPSVVSTILTVILLILFGIGSGFFLLVALNGFSESDGLPGLITTVVCNIVGIIVSAILAWRLPRWLMSRFNWNGVLAVLASVVSGFLLGSGLSTAALFIGVFAAVIIRDLR